MESENSRFNRSHMELKLNKQLSTNGLEDLTGQVGKLENRTKRTYAEISRSRIDEHGIGQIKKKNNMQYNQEMYDKLIEDGEEGYLIDVMQNTLNRKRVEELTQEELTEIREKFNSKIPNQILNSLRDFMTPSSLALAVTDMGGTPTFFPTNKLLQMLENQCLWDQIENISYHPNKRYLIVEFVTIPQAERFSKSYKTLDSQVLVPVNFKRDLIYTGKVKNANRYMNETVLKEILSKYGTLISYKRDVHKFGNKEIQNNNVTFQIKLNPKTSLTDIPSIIPRGVLPMFISFKGIPPECLICRERGHIGNVCPSRLCTKCNLFKERFGFHRCTKKNSIEEQNKNREISEYNTSAGKSSSNVKESKDMLTAREESQDENLTTMIIVNKNKDLEQESMKINQDKLAMEDLSGENRFSVLDIEGEDWRTDSGNWEDVLQEENMDTQLIEKSGKRKIGEELMASFEARESDESELASDTTEMDPEKVEGSVEKKGIGKLGKKVNNKKKKINGGKNADRHKDKLVDPQKFDNHNSQGTTSNNTIITKIEQSSAESNKESKLSSHEQRPKLSPRVKNKEV